MTPTVYRPLSGPLVVTIPAEPKPRRRPYIPVYATYQRYLVMGWDAFSQWNMLVDLGVPRPTQNGNGTWSVSRKYQADLPKTIAEQFGSCELIKEFNNRQKCDKRCRDAVGMECVCSCLGKYHGQGDFEFDNGPGLEVGEDTLISVAGEISVVRTLIEKERA